MPETLPERANLEWLKKTAKQDLARLRDADPQARLADSQRDLARRFGFPSWRALRAALAKRAAADAPSEAEAAAFLRAVGEGETEAVRTRLAARPALAAAVGPHPYWGGRPQPLHVAVELDRGPILDLLLDAGADPNGRNAEYDHWSPLMLAIQRGRAAMVSTLRARGARIGLAEALLLGDDRALARLLRKGLPAAAPNGGSWLAFARTVPAIDRLLALGVDPRAPDHWGVTPVAALSGIGPRGRDLVRRLMLAGIRPEPRQFARLGDRDGLEHLAADDPAILGDDGLLIAAIDGGHPDLAAWLLGRGANPNAIDADQPPRQTALHVAAWQGDLATARRLVEAGADPDARDSQYGSTPLGWAQTALKITGNMRCAEVADYLAGMGSG